MDIDKKMNKSGVFRWQKIRLLGLGGDMRSTECLSSLKCATLDLIQHAKVKKVQDLPPKCGGSMNKQYFKTVQCLSKCTLLHSINAADYGRPV